MPPEPVLPAEKSEHSEWFVAAGKMIFGWTSSVPFDSYIVEISQDSSFATVSVKEKAVSGFYHLTAPLKKGKYFWRVSGVSQGAVTRASAVREFSVADNRKPLAVSADTGGAGSMDFKWSDRDGAGRYRLDIYADRNRERKIYTGDFSSFSASVRDLPLGECYWTVSSLDASGSVIAVSDAAKTAVTAMLDIPVIVYPGNNARIDLMKTVSLDFSWNPVRDATSYEFALYQYSFAFDKLLKKTAVSDTKYSIKDFSSLTSGNFYWSVTAVRNAGGSVSAQSLPAKGYFNIPAGPDIKPPALGNMRIYVE